MKSFTSQLLSVVFVGALFGLVLHNFSGRTNELDFNKNITFLKLIDLLPFISVSSVKPSNKVPTFSPVSKETSDKYRDWPSHVEEVPQNNVCMWYTDKSKKSHCDYVAKVCEEQIAEEQYAFGQLNKCITRIMNNP